MTTYCLDHCHCKCVLGSLRIDKVNHVNFCWQNVREKHYPEISEYIWKKNLHYGFCVLLVFFYSILTRLVWRYIFYYEMRSRGCEGPLAVNCFGCLISPRCICQLLVKRRSILRLLSIPACIWSCIESRLQWSPWMSSNWERPWIHRQHWSESATLSWIRLSKTCATYVQHFLLVLHQGNFEEQRAPPFL